MQNYQSAEHSKVITSTNSFHRRHKVSFCIREEAQARKSMATSHEESCQSSKAEVFQRNVPDLLIYHQSPGAIVDVHVSTASADV